MSLQGTQPSRWTFCPCATDTNVITMDDLDHSMHISDHDWVNFFEESEECCLLQASLACPDSPDYSDGEDLDCTTRTYTPLNEQQAESQKPQVVEVSSVVCPAEEESKVEQKPLSNGPEVEPKLLVEKGVLQCTEKERWFVTVNDNPPQHQNLASGTVVTKKRKQKKVWKDKLKDGKHHTCGNTDIITQVPEELFSDTNTQSLETEVNQTPCDVLCKGHSLHHLDTGHVKSGICANINQLKSPDSETIQEVYSGNTSIELSMGLACLGVSYKDSTLHFAVENRSEASKTKRDTGNGTIKCMEMPDIVFIQEKEPDFERESSQTELTVDLASTGDTSVEDNLDTNKWTNSICFELDVKNQADFGHIQEEKSTERTLKDLNMNLACIEDSCDSKLQGSKNVDLDATNNSTVSGANLKKCSFIESFKQDQSYFGALCKEYNVNLSCGKHAESIMDGVTDNPDSIVDTTESDEFADAEFFSSSSYDSETYHSAAESTEDPLRLSVQNSPCNLSISINDDSLEDKGMHSCLQHDGNRLQIETSQIFPSAHLSADNMPNDNSMCSDGTKSTALGMSVDTPTSADNSSSSLGGQSESLLQVDISMEGPEAYAKATGNNEPVYAISAFWDEMEKLTINDILHIRMGRCMLPVEEALTTNKFKSSTTIIPESAVLDTLDAADSDYCTNLDKSKPDRSSCDFSTSDFEEEYWQFISSSQNSSPDLHDKSYQNQCMDYDSTGEEESDEIGTPVPSEDCTGQKWTCESTFVSCDVVVPHQMRKNKSMYDVHALKKSSSKSLEESWNMSDGFEVVTPIMYQDEHYQISFPKVFEYLFVENKAKYEAMSVSVYGLKRNPDLHINDYTFCTTINDMSIRHYSEEPIPIFSCSRPTVRELTFPKPGCIFLGTKYAAMKDVSPIQIISQPIVRSMNCKQTDQAFCFSKDLSSLYSVKNICFFEKGYDTWRYHSDDDDEEPVHVGDSSITLAGDREVLSMTQQMFKETALRQISMENNHVISDYQSIFATIKQSDMCLVCIAFASWVLRSSDPEAADTWKAALLANVSALSAIQYLRQYMKKKASPHDD